MAKRKGKSKQNKVSTISKQATVDSPPEQLNTQAAKPPTNQTVFLKVCRLCEAKDGPFLNIFDTDKVTAKRIDDLLPFVIAENDDLPHKICFRCSAKVEELHEFVQKCIKAQENLRLELGIIEPMTTKRKTRIIWEEKLNKSKMSNDDICDALIKKAMEGIKDFPLKSLEANKEIMKSKELKTQFDEVTTEITGTNDGEMLKKNEEHVGDFIPVRASRSKTSQPLLGGLEFGAKVKRNASKANEVENSKSKSLTELDLDSKQSISKNETGNMSDKTINSFSLEHKPVDEPKTENPVLEKVKPFDIMDHISMIKVNGVGVLFQCKLCNRNFLKEEVVKSHACAKNGVPKITDKIDLTRNLSTPEPPKVSSVKYINTKDIDVIKPSITSVKQKPKAGPASKTKHNIESTSTADIRVVSPNETTPPQQTVQKAHLSASVGSVQLPNALSVKSRYKLVPGPNNKFTLVEESKDCQQNDSMILNNDETMRTSLEPKPKGKSKDRKSNKSEEKNVKKSPSPDVIDLDDDQPQTEKLDQQPYPVGLFQTVPHHSGTFPPNVHPSQTVSFTTPAMKKQSYTIVQTGNPSKLLISTKRQPPPAAVEMPDVLKKRPKKAKHENPSNDPKQPFSVTIEDASRAKDSGFFSFINLDPLLQPSYVLPTDSIIQESQISTSTPVVKPVSDHKDNLYSCNMCNEKFTREKKLQTHIQSHYKKMDEEDEQRAEKPTRKRSRKS